MHLITNKKFPEKEFNQRLRFQTEPVKIITPLLQQVAIDLLEEMYKLNAIGLAANQMGLKMRLCVIDPSYMDNEKVPIIMFNPEVIECGEELYLSPESCLSLPNIGVQVPRFRNIKVKFLGLDGKEHIIKDDNSLLSSILQHEIDHLLGFLMTDRSLERIDIKYKQV